jgi:hypothetical protein
LGSGVNASLALQNLRRVKSESEKLTNNGKPRLRKRVPSLPKLKCQEKPIPI